VAREALQVFPDSPVKRELIEVVDFCVERAY
jgi:octaprenyl-diphosphate synthase